MTFSAAALLFALVAGFVLWFIWPTPYRELRIRTSSDVLAAREQRFTGRVEFLSDDGWHPVVPPERGIDRLRRIADDSTAVP